MRLKAVLAEIHVFAGRTNWKQPLRLGLAFEDRPFLRITERRGDGVRFDSRPLEPADFGEGGRVEVHDVTKRLLPDLAGSELSSLIAVEDGSGHPLGVALLRESRPPFCIWIQGDEFFWGGEARLKAAPFETGVWPVFGRAL